MSGELKNHVWERKGFDKWIGKITNEGGEIAFRDWAFDLQLIIKQDAHFKDFLQRLQEIREDVTEQLLVAIDQGASMVTVHFHDVPRPDGTLLFAQEVLPHLRWA